jgi:hypothetical protein
MPNDLKTEDWNAILDKQTHIPPFYLESLREFFKTEVPNVISKHELDVGLLNPDFKIKHDIDTGDHAPVSSKAHVLNPVRSGQLRVCVTHLLDIGHAIKKDSPWAQPAFLVPKRDGTVRMVFDSRRLNSVTVPSKYPNKKISAILEEIALAKPTIFSIADIRSAFNNIELTPEAQLKAAVITGDDLFVPTCLRPNMPSAKTKGLTRP